MLGLDHNRCSQPADHDFPTPVQSDGAVEAQPDEESSGARCEPSAQTLSTALGSEHDLIRTNCRRIRPRGSGRVRAAGSSRGWGGARLSVVRARARQAGVHSEQSDGVKARSRGAPSSIETGARALGVRAALRVRG
eukprot:2026732-Rhodomonas_salina.2